MKPCEACGHANLLNGEIVHASNCPVKYPEYAAPAKLGQLSRSCSTLEPRFTEAGIQVYQVSDYEWVAAATEDEAVAFILKEWGYDNPGVAESDGCFERKDVHACDLDKNTLNVAEDAEDGGHELATYREALKAHLTKGETFPLFFCGIDA